MEAVLIRKLQGVVPVAAILFAVLFVILTGMFIMAAALMLMNGAIGLGFISYNALASWYQKSLTLGTGWFLRLVFTAGGMMTGVFGCILFGLLFHTKLPLIVIMLGGIAAGVAGGVLSGVIAFSMLRRFFRQKADPSA